MKIKQFDDTKLEEAKKEGYDEGDLLIIKDQIAEIISGMEYRSDRENKKLLRQIFNKI